jgi:C-terminal processing protease CtpA/Prc
MIDWFVYDAIRQGLETWQADLEKALANTFTAKDADGAYAEVDTMLRTLGDPFTRLLRPLDADYYHKQTDGQVL